MFSTSYRSRILIVTFIIFGMFTGLLNAQDDGLTDAQERQIRSTRDRQIINTTEASNFTALDLATAADIDASSVTGATIDGPGLAASVLPTFGVVNPTKGNSMVALSTGIVSVPVNAEPGGDFVPGFSADGDEVTLELQIALSTSPSTLGFDFNFFTSEAPEFTGQFNDSFSVTLTDDTGTREITRIGADSPSLIPTAIGNAGGTGFERLEDGIIPDAATSGWQTVVTELSGTTATVAFTVRDTGDGIYDSLSLIDNVILTQGVLDVVDPNPGFIQNGAVVTDPQILAQGGAPRTGIAADGVTRLLLRAPVAGPGVVNFCLYNSTAPQDGGLALLGSDERAQCVEASAVQTTAGYFGMALYRAPDDFNRGGDELLGDRPVQISAFYRADDGNDTVAIKTLNLVRSPVVFVHGLWSDAGTWQFDLATDPRFEVYFVDYSDTNASYFSVNADKPNIGIQAVTARMREQGVAVTQVELYSHSMGGILSRLTVAADGYYSNETYGEGNVNRIITANTPHFGTPAANRIIDIREITLPGLIPDPGDIFAGIVEEIVGPIDEGAVDDLIEWSDPLQAIPQVEVPSHVFVGVGADADLLSILAQQVPVIGGQLEDLFEFLGIDPIQWFDEPHDGLVEESSQASMMPMSARTIFDGDDSIHTATNDSVNYSNGGAALLNMAVGSEVFDFLPNPSTYAPQDVPLVQYRNDNITVTENALTIQSSITGTSVTSGQPFTVNIAPAPNAPITEMLLVGKNYIQRQPAPFTFNVTVPLEHVGEYTLMAVGKDAAGNLYLGDDLLLNATPAATLLSISTRPEYLYFYRPGVSQSMTIMGEYSDGVTRRINDLPGITITPSNAAVASRSASGYTANNPGAGVIVIRSGGLTHTVSVRVQGFSQTAPIANAGPDVYTLTGQTVTLDGSLSYDLDGSTLSYSWAQVSGPSVTLSNQTVAMPTFTPLEPGIYTLSLMVNDGEAQSLLPDNVNVYVSDGSAVAGVPPRISPDGTVNNAVTHLQWVPNPQDEWYQVIIVEANGGPVVMQTWVPATAESTGASGQPGVCALNICTLALDKSLVNGDYVWWMQSWSELNGLSGYAFAGAQTAFTVDVPAPGEISVISPADGTTTNTPSLTLEWNADSAAAWYHVVVYQDDGTVGYNEWLDSATVCARELCRISTLNVLPDTYKLFIESWGPGGMGPSRITEFTYDPDVLSAPAGVSAVPNQGRPTVRFVYDPALLWFGVRFSQNGTPVETLWYEAGLYCSVDTCTVDPAVDLPGGSYQVSVQGWNPAGITSWSGGVTLELPTTPPVNPVNIGVLDPAAAQPQVTFDGSENATWYEIYVGSDDGFLNLSWSPAADLGCANAETCTTEPIDGMFTAGQTYAVYIRAYGPGGLSDYSEGNFAYGRTQ